MKLSSLHHIYFILFLFIFSCEQQHVSQPDDVTTVDTDELLADVKYLSSDDLKGRRTGTEANQTAQNFILERFRELALNKFDSTFRFPFEHQNPRTGETFGNAVNLIGIVEGSEYPDRYIAVTAHYDHLGIQNGEIYNGADDNASGTGGLLAAARYFTTNQPKNSILFIAFDAEEQGLGGARHFVNHPVVPLDQIALNINMDMISTNFENELYAVGTYHYPFLKPVIEKSTSGAPVNVLFGYDSADWPQDWTMASDHGPFHEKGIPFIYFGVEDHEHYHQPTDIFDHINPEFYINSVITIINVLQEADIRLDTIISKSGR